MRGNGEKFDETKKKEKKKKKRERERERKTINKNAVPEQNAGETLTYDGVSSSSFY